MNELIQVILIIILSVLPFISIFSGIKVLCMDKDTYNKKKRESRLVSRYNRGKSLSASEKNELKKLLQNTTLELDISTKNHKLQPSLKLSEHVIDELFLN